MHIKSKLTFISFIFLLQLQVLLKPLGTIVQTTGKIARIIGKIVLTIGKTAQIIGKIAVITLIPAMEFMMIKVIAQVMLFQKVMEARKYL